MRGAFGRGREQRERALRKVALLLVAGFFAACRSPTQITLDISTDALCVDVDETHVALGQLGAIEGATPSAVTRACQKGSGAYSRIGDLVIVPHKNKDETIGIEVWVGVGQPTEACHPPDYDGGCIVARRALAFQPHDPITLPIELDVSCLDIPCGATQTCRNGTCVDAFLEDPKSCSDPAGCGEGAGVGGSGDGATGGDGSGGDLGDGGGAADGGKNGNSGGVDGAGGAAAGGKMNGGASSGGANGTGGETSSGGDSGSGGAASGGAASGGSGGTIEECGNGTVDSNEACDDNNLEDNDGCGSECREEFLLAVDNTSESLILLDRVTGDYVRDFAVAPDANPFAPLYAAQLPTREVLVTDQANGTVTRYDVHGNYVDRPITGRIGIGQIAPMGQDVVLADTPLTIETLSSTDLSYLADAAWTDDAYAVQPLDDRWLLSAGINYGEVQLFDRQSLGFSALTFDAVGVLDLHFTMDGRVLVADFAGDEVIELAQTTVPTPPEVLGLPLAVGRTVAVPFPFSAFELPGGNWLVGANSGLFVYDPDTDMLVANKGTNRIRTIELYEGPLPGE